MEKFENIAFLIPIQPRHYHYLYDVLNLLKNNRIIIDIYLIFSNEDEYNLFEKKSEIKKIIIPEKHYNNTKNHVTFKKFFALELLKEDVKYEYFIVCDSEISLIHQNLNEKNILEKIKKIYENKIIYAGKVTAREYYCPVKILENSANLFSNDVDKLKNITENYSLFYWWSDLPIYKREHLTDFFSKINYNDIIWEHFDHVIYLNYLILYHEFKILNITEIINHNWSLEEYNTDDIENLNILKINKYGFSYITPVLYNKFKEFLMKEGSFILYHLDR